MPYINLIQEQQLARQRSDRHRRSMLFGVVFVVCGSAMVYGGIMLATESLRAKAAVLDAEVRQVTPVLQQIDAVNKQADALSPRLKTLQDAQLLTDRWSRILQHLSTQTPSDAWLTTIRCSQSDTSKPIQISFIGMTTSQSPISEFILRMQNCDDLDNVTFNHSDERVVGQTKGTEFQVDSELAGTAKAKVVDEQGDNSK